MTTTCLVVMGVSGAGKSTVAQRLADRLGWPMAEGDEFHPEANIAKMKAGTPLADTDREPWLRTLRDWISQRDSDGENSVVTCSALKRSYRDVLRGATARVRFVHLSGSRDQIGSRMSERTGHFMPPGLLDSQFDDLEPLAPDESGVTVDIAGSPGDTTESALIGLGIDVPA
ncbi:gluconokinase [Glycomyces sp. L485]|uniref:gluconokinase n=1 Tax=Glycomyces sp. L485 TaxID=2909235 RepID=UPI001F4AF56A|nr:gluconokinase [Glycomyces sp. L485]MCH7230263.1 gluconokinase [Glycomyces sp. L485]